jgi:hypothetical protein
LRMPTAFTVYAVEVVYVIHIKVCLVHSLVKGLSAASRGDAAA